MALNFLLKRSGTADKRPDPSSMALGELDLNYDDITGGIFYKNASGSVVKVGPAQVSGTAPNGTPVGSAGNSAGEFWYDTANAELKIFDGTSWVTTGVSGITNTAFTAAGTILVGTGLNTFASVSVGTDGQVLIADSGEASGVRWGDFPVASTTGAGIVQLNDSVTSTSTTEAATANSVKTTYDAAVAAQSDATQALADAAAAAGDVGDLSALTTTDKSSAVAAINEVDAAADAAQSDATQALSDASSAQTTADLAIPCACVTAKGDLLAGAAASTPTALSVGTNGQVLSANSACTTGLEWIDSGTALPTGGTDGQFLVVDNNCPDGLTWADNPTQPTETSAVCTVAPYQPPVGTALEGGYFGGYISTTADGVADYALIVSPKASGEFCRRWWWCNCESTPPEVFNNTVYGKPATECGATISGMDTFQCINALTIGGCTDWYVPAFYEMDILYKNLKPDLPGACFTCPCSNDPFSGCNPYSVPPQNETYCSPNNPTRTTATAFRRNQSEAFFSTRYWTATQYNSFGNYACTLNFDDGGDNQVNKTTGYYSRAIRRVPASALGSGEVLSFPDAQGLTALSVGDTIRQDTTGASGTITCIDLVSNQVIVDSVTGTFQDGYAIPLTPGYIPFPTDSSTDDQVLTACAACDGGVTWTTPAYIPCAEITAKGDLLAGTAASTPTALPVGADGQFLVADSGSATGLAWADNPTAPTETGTVSSINPILPSSGTALCGGYYAGSIDDAGTCVALIIAPKDVGQIRCSNGVQQDWLPTTISRSTTNGALITECFRCSVLTSGSFAFEYAYNLNACGYNDWYIPARCEMLTVVQQLGRNFTTVPDFQAGGSQVMDCNSYSTATEASTASVWTQSSVSCSLSTGQQLKNNASDLRLIRREPLSNLAACTALSFSSAQGFDALSVGDQITQSGTGAVVSICALDSATCSMTVSTVSGSLSTGCAFPLTGGYVPAPIDAGTDGQVLKVCTACDSGTVWANATTGTVTSVTAGTGLTGGTITGSGTIALDTACVVAPSILTTKGDIIAASAASTPTALPVGTDGQVLSANSACTTGLEWVDAGGGGGAEATPLVAGTVYGCIGFSGTTGYQCSTLLGGDVGTGSTVYCDSTVIGYSAASSLTCVNKSVVLGTFAGTAAGFADMVNIVAIGFCAMRETPYSATDSVVIGALAGLCANNNSIYVGSGAGRTPTGTYNVAIGSRAMFCKATLGCNVAIGTCAFYNIDGGCNVAIGHCAGVYTGSCCLTGSNNTIIGAGALPVNNTASNEMILGNNALACIRSRVTSITAISDARDKTDITALPVGLDFVNALNPVKFTWQHREPIESKDGTMEAGFIAQEMDEVEQQFNAADYLDLVSKDDPNQWAVTQGHLIPVLVKAIQELSDKNDALEARIAALEGN